MADSAFPLVTVITATFQLIRSKREEQFRTCVESIHGQTYPAIEHLVIDGGSDDGSLELIREYERNGRLTCISEPDKGIYDAMNKGMRLAKGKYIAFLNSDDSWHDPNGVARTVELLERAKGDFSYAPYRCLSPDGTPEYIAYPQISAFPYAMPLCHQTMFTRTELMRQHGGFRFPQFRCSADYDLVVRLLISGAKPVYVPFCFTSFRRGGFSGEYAQLSRDEVEMIVKEHFGTYLEPDDHLEWIWQQSPVVPIELLRAVGNLVHPSVAAQLHGYVSGPWVDDYHVAVSRPGFLPRPEQTPQRKIAWRLFHFLPFLTIKSNATTTKVSLFGIPNLLQIKKKKNEISISIFCFIPLMKIKLRHN